MDKRYVLGHEAMARMGAANVLLLGLGGLGVEIGMSTLSLSQSPKLRPTSQEHDSSRCQGRHALRPRPSDSRRSSLSSKMLQCVYVYQEIKPLCVACSSSCTRQTLGNHGMQSRPLGCKNSMPMFPSPFSRKGSRKSLCPTFKSSLQQTSPLSNSCG